MQRQVLKTAQVDPPINFHSGPQHARPEKINNIQVLRAIAALLVAYFHLDVRIGSLRPIGSFGVEIFFVISGFIMAHISVVAPERFFLRRIARILPLYWGCTILIFFAAAWAPQYFRSTRPELIPLLKSLFFIPFEKESGLMQPLLYLGWTLNYEMLFYAIMAVALTISRRYATLLTSVLLLVLMTCCALFAGQSKLAWFYSRPLMFGFILGIGVFWLSRILPADRCRHDRTLLLVLIVFSSAALVAAEGLGIESELMWTLLATILVGSVVLLSKGGYDTRFWPVILLGDASYALYLLHPYVEGFFHFGLRQILSPEDPIAWALVLAVTLAVAVLVHVLLERPITTKLNSLVWRPKLRQRQVAG